MRPRTLLATLAVTGVLVAGCGDGSDRGAGASGSASPSGTSSSSPSGTSSPSAMDMDMGSADKPSDPAAMICGLEIQGAVKRTFAMSRQPTSTQSWSKSDRLFSCTYRVPRGELRMSVQDALDDSTGRAHFDRLRDSLPGATTIVGMDNFGFPAFSTRSGDVVFLKDGKTLRVDASALPSDALPTGYTRSEAAFSVASAVIACWTE